MTRCEDWSSGSTNEVFVRIEFGRNERQARRAVKGTRAMLGSGGRGEAFRQIVSTSPLREDVCTQRRKTAVLAAKNAADLVASLNGSLRDHEFSFELGPQLPDDPPHADRYRRADSGWASSVQGSEKGDEIGCDATNNSGSSGTRPGSPACASQRRKAAVYQTRDVEHPRNQRGLRNA